jgi:short-chain Z-isoprenyl diphosphate synthase
MAGALRAAEAGTADNPGLHVNVAIAYGGRHEVRDAVRSLLASEAAKGNTLDQLAGTLEIDHISDHLYTAGQPDPDLIIRTSGEQRMSGFLIWQSAHSEYYFCEALWPDFRKVDFIRALRAYAQRERRYGH